MNPLLGAQWIAVAVLGLGSMSIGLLPPLCISRFRRTRSLPSVYRAILSCLLCLGAGVLFSTSIIHITNEARSVLSAIQVGIPVTEAMLGAGFLFVYFVEEVVHLFLHCCSSRVGSETSNLDHSHSQRTHNYVVRYSSRGGDGPPCYGSVKICPQEEDLRDTTENLITSDITPLLTPPARERSHSQLSHTAASVASSSLLLLALSLHSSIEGLTIGLESSANNVIFMLSMVAIHKFVISFCLGMEMSLSGWDEEGPPPFGRTAAFMTVFSLTSVLGIFAGIFVRYAGVGITTGDTVCAMLQATTAGALLHVALLEILPRERSRCHNIGFAQFIAVTIGFGVSLALQYFIS